MIPLHDNDKSPVADINRRATKAVEQAATVLRSEIIETAFLGVVAYVTQQQEDIERLRSEGRLGTEDIGMTVLHVASAMPFVDDEPRPALSLLLAPDKSLGQERVGQECLKIFLPVSADIRLDETFDPDALEMVDLIMVERVDELGNVRSFIITVDGVEEFQSEFHTGEQLRGEEFPGARHKVLGHKVLDFASKRINPQDAMISQLLTDMTDWSAEVQQVWIPEED